MDREEAYGLLSAAADRAERSEENRIPGSWERMFERPIFAFGSADDPLFDALKDPKCVGPEHMSPKEWMPEARTVIVMFFPMSDKVRVSNASGDFPSREWGCARREGQAFISKAAAGLVSDIRGAGYKAVSPEQDPSFRWTAPTVANWSLRHCAYICGLGTFGMSKSLITEAGCAGRLCSVLTDTEIPPTPRRYSGLYDWCIWCGACARACPVSAIDPRAPPGKNKNDAVCSARLREAQEACGSPSEVGGGKCQAGVPCSRGRPRKR